MPNPQRPDVVAGRRGDLLVCAPPATAENGTALIGQDARKLKRSPPVVQKFYQDKKIDIVGGVYDIATGKITMI